MKMRMCLIIRNIFQAEYMFNGVNRAQAAVAPRLFCDICDAFDLHDTEGLFLVHQ